MTPAHECRPGERMVAGRVFCFNAELLNDHLAAEAVANAPASLSGLDESALALLSHRCGRLWSLNEGRDGPWTKLRLRVEAERRRRFPEPQLQKKDAA